VKSYRLLALFLLPACAPDRLDLGPLVDASQSFSPTGDGGYAATVAGMHVEVTGASARLGTSTSAIDLRLAAWGRGKDRTTTADVTPEPGACLEGPEDCIRPLGMAHDGVTAWWIAEASGARQAWTVSRKPEGRGNLVLATEVTGATRIVPRPGGAVIHDAAGGQWTVSELSAWDAAGRALPTSLQVEGDQLVVVVDDTDAVYPIVVDPLYETAPTALYPYVYTTDSSHTPTTTVANNFGRELRNVGDLNGDGADDLAVGDWTTGGGALSAGTVSIFYGSADQALGTPDPLGFASTEPDVLIEGADDELCGYSIASAIDLDEDGYTDLVYGCPGANELRLHYGGPSGIAAVADDARNGGTDATQFGLGVNVVGDVDGDGHAELYVGGLQGTESLQTFEASTGGPSTGDVWEILHPWVTVGTGDNDGDGYDDLVFVGYAGGVVWCAGGGSGFDPAACWPLVGLSVDVAEVSDHDTALRVGDMNADGYDDFVIGNPRLTFGAGGDVDTAGKWMIYPGAARVAGVPTVSFLGPKPTTGYRTNEAGHGLAALGDVNNDGRPDFAIGAPEVTGGPYAGLVDIASGAGGIFERHSGSDVPTTEWDPNSEVYEFGAQLAAGDFDGNGKVDLVVGAPDVAGLNPGSVHLYFGCDDTDGDNVCDADDICPLDSPDDSDGDGVCTSEDACPGGDDTVDGDADGVADACDACPLDAANDTDGDTVCDSDDTCPFDIADDSDGDGSCDSEDPCPVDPLDDSDGDAACDSVDPCPADAADDSDGDGLCDGADPCPTDGANDADGDGICEGDDLCPGVADPAQSDVDGDGVGDVCEPDTDGDGIVDDDDNCPLTSNASQLDGDADGAGDACDTDDDADGVADDMDTCLDTPSGTAVNDNGCSLDQSCPCANPWRNQGAYVKCVSAAATVLVRDGAVTEAQRGALVSARASGTCGR
jgi:hypothetical protein